MVDSPHHNNDREEIEKQPYDWKAFILAFFALLIAGIAAGFAYWQADIARNVFKYQRIADSTNSADQRKKDSLTFAVARENYIEENRPFVFPDCPTMDTTRYGNIIAYLPIVNHGNTPAYRVNRCISFQRGKTLRNPKNFKYDSIWTWMTLAPHSTETMVILNDKWDTSSTAFPYVVGSIWYSDNWSNRLHHTTFAYKWIHKYGDRFVRQYQLESVDRYKENQTNK